MRCFDTAGQGLRMATVAGGGDVGNRFLRWGWTIGKGLTVRTRGVGAEKRRSLDMVWGVRGSDCFAPLLGHLGGLPGYPKPDVANSIPDWLPGLSGTVSPDADCRSNSNTLLWKLSLSRTHYVRLIAVAPDS